MAIFSDTFTTGTNQALSAHAPDVGTSWTLLWTTTDEATTGWTVPAASDRAQQITVINSGSIYTCDGTYPSADYDITCTLTGHGTAAGASIYLFVRIQDQENMYAVKLTDNNSGTTTCQLYKKVSGTWTALGSAFNPPAEASVIKLQIIGSALKFFDDGVEIASATDTDITAAGKAGIGGAGGAELVTTGDDSSTSNHLDNLSVNDLGAVTLVVADAAAVTQIDAPVLTQVHALTIADVTAVTQIDAVTLTQAHNLTIADVTSVTQIDAPVLTQTHNLSLADLDVVTQVDVLTLSQVHNLTLADLDVVTQVDAFALTQLHILTLSDLTAVTQIDATVLSAGAITLSVADLTVEPTLDTPVVPAFWTGMIDVTLPPRSLAMTLEDD